MTRAIAAVFLIGSAAGAARPKEVQPPRLPGAQIRTAIAAPVVAAASAAGRQAGIEPGAKDERPSKAQLDVAGAVPDANDAEKRAFYERVFSGAGSESAPASAASQAAAASAVVPEAPGAVDALRADVQKVLRYVSGKGQRRLRARILAVSFSGGIPSRVSTGLFSSKPAVDPIDRDLLSHMSPMMESVARLEADSGSQPLSYALTDLLYSMNVLAERAKTRQEMLDSFWWLWGTYGVGSKKPF
jgi:hypothetical protein